MKLSLKWTYIFDIVHMDLSKKVQENKTHLGSKQLFTLSLLNVLTNLYTHFVLRKFYTFNGLKLVYLLSFLFKTIYSK